MVKLTLADLKVMIDIAERSGATDDTPVHIAYTYGDRWATTVAPGAGDAELLHIERSGYHQMDKLTEDEGDSQTDNSMLAFVIQ